MIRRTRFAFSPLSRLQAMSIQQAVLAGRAVPSRLIWPRHAVGFLFSAAALLASTEAAACGGLFCNTASAVNQTAERIVFAQDAEGNVTQIVEVLYEGEADKFAWLLPVPGTPTPGMSSTQALDALQSNTNPIYQLNVTRDTCEIMSGSGGSAASFPGSTTGTSTGTTGAGGIPPVVVLDSGKIGKLEYDTISLTDPTAENAADVAVQWLEANDYDVGDIGAAVLEPYLANGLNLIAFKLEKGATTGSIRPIRLDFVADDKNQVGMSIPIRPTAVAANDDMPILVWVLGDSRAVPTNYYSLEINELLINWFSPTFTYNNVITAAADAAGGQGFVTEFAGNYLTASQGNNRISVGEDIVSYQARQAVFDQLVSNSSGESLITSVVQNFGTFDGMLDVVRDVVPLRASVTSEEFVASTYCYFNYDPDAYSFYGGYSCAGYEVELDEQGNPVEDPIVGLDEDAFIAAVQEQVLDPIGDLHEMIGEMPYMTRLYTTMSADEMSKDPTFDFNPDLEPFPNVHTAEAHQACDFSFEVTLPDGVEVRGETWGTWPYSPGDESGMPENARVLQFSNRGEPEVIEDSRTTIAGIHRTMGGLVSTSGDGDADSGSSGPAGESQGGGGCSTVSGSISGSSPWIWVLGGLSLLGRLWRRRARGQ